MFEAIKFSLQFLFSYFGCAIYFAIVILRAQNDENAGNEPDGVDEENADENADDHLAGQVENGQNNDEDTASEWSDSSSIDRAFMLAYERSQVFR